MSLKGKGVDKMGDSSSSAVRARFIRDFSWQRSFSERMKGFRDTTFSRFWKSYREHQLKGKTIII